MFVSDLDAEVNVCNQVGYVRTILSVDMTPYQNHAYMSESPCLWELMCNSLYPWESWPSSLTGWEPKTYKEEEVEEEKEKYDNRYNEPPQGFFP